MAAMFWELWRYLVGRLREADKLEEIAVMGLKEDEDD
jgi:hypothetical protein